MGTLEVAEALDDDRTIVRQMLTNPAATAFWHKAIRYPFREYETGEEIVQSFTAGVYPG